MPVPYGGVQRKRERPNPVIETLLTPITRVVGSSIAAGSSGDGVVVPPTDTDVAIIKKAEDQALTSTTLTNLDGLVFALEANTDYIAHFCVVVQVANTNNGYRLAVTCPSGVDLLTYTGWLPTKT